MHSENPLYGRSIGILGDSISTFAGFVPEESKCYYPSAAGTDVLRVEQTWWHLLMDRHCMKLIVNDSYSGATVCTHNREDQPVSASFVERVKRSFSGENPPDYIFLFGLTNDNWLDRTVGQLQFADWTETDLRQALPAYCYVLDYLARHNPQAKIVTIINTGMKPEVDDGMIRAAEHYGAYVVELQSIQESNGHPTAQGMIQIADQIEAVVL